MSATPDDAWVLASAIAAGVDGDPDLLVLAESLPELHITNPRGFWEMHRRP